MTVAGLRRATVAPLGVARRRLRSDPLFAAALFAAVAATAFLFALVPQLFDRLAADSLEQTVAGANAVERDLAISGAGRIDAAEGDDPVASVLALGETHLRQLPHAVQGVLGERRAVVESARYTIVTPQGQPEPAGTTRYVTLRHLEDAGRLTAVEGDLPSGGAEPAELPFPEQSFAVRLEVALSAPTARQLSVGLGETLYLLPAEDDPLVRGVPASDRRYLGLEVVGILGARQEDEAWLRDSLLGEAAIRDTESRRFVYGYALLSGRAYRDLLAGVDPVPLRYEWQHRVDPAAVAESDAGRLASGLRQAEAAFGQTTFGRRLGFGVRTGLGRILERHETDRRAAGAVLAVGGIALLAVALTVLGVLSALAAERRAEAIALLRSRGGSLPQTLAAQAVEGLLVAVPAGALGYAAATLAAGRPPGLLPALLVAGIVLAAGALLAGVALAPARRALSARDRGDAPVARPSPLRLAVEALVVVASLAGVYLLRRRGLAGEGGFDPFLAAVPVLAGLAAGLLALRLYPLPLRALAWLAAPRDDLVPVLGLRRLARQPSLAAAPLLVVLLAASVGAFAATLATTIAAAQSRAPAAGLTPLDRDTLDVFRAGIAVAGAYAALALVLAPVLTARPRLRDLAYLRALGLSRRQAVGLAAFELWPPVAAALAVGLLLGVALGYLVAPGLDLRALAANEPAGVRPALLAPALLTAAIVLVTAVVTVIVAAAAARVSIGRVLRTGER